MPLGTGRAVKMLQVLG